MTEQRLGVTVSPREWIQRGRQGLSVGVCRDETCGGALYVPTEPTATGGTVRVPFVQRDGIRFFEAICAACGLGFVEVAGPGSEQAHGGLGVVVPKSIAERAHASDPRRDGAPL